MENLEKCRLRCTHHDCGTFAVLLPRDAKAALTRCLMGVEAEASCWEVKAVLVENDLIAWCKSVISRDKYKGSTLVSQ